MSASLEDRAFIPAPSRLPEQLKPPIHSGVLVTGVAGLVAGAMSMAAGEYVSVHSQADTEKADLKLERAELADDNEGEHKKLMEIYVARGLNSSLANEVARQLMAHDAGPRWHRRAALQWGQLCLSSSLPWPHHRRSSL